MGLNACPDCGLTLDRCTGPIPASGGIRICARCASLFTRDLNGVVRDLTDEELLDIATSPLFARVRAARKIVHTYIANRKKATP